MKKLKALLVTFIVFGLFYLLGCFANNSFDLANWGEMSKDFVSTFGGLLAIIAGIMVVVSEMEG